MYQGKVRVRACGLLFDQGKLLLLKHQGIGERNHLWSPPGGGVEFGDSAKQTLKREFYEETGLEVSVNRFLFMNEHIDDKHHAIELFFKVQQVSGKLRLGRDPELKHQILTDIRYFSLEEIKNLEEATYHSLFSSITSFEDLNELHGYYKFADLVN